MIKKKINIQYASYAEIDRDMEILKMEREIHLEKVKLELENAKDNLKFGNLIEGYIQFSKDKPASTILKTFRVIVPFVLKFMKGKKT